MINSATAADSSPWLPGERDKLKPLPDQLANKETFLQLLVSQLKNQNPLNPQDGMQFVAQLAQFSQLEQTMSMSQDLAAIRQTLQQAEDSKTGATATGGAAK